MAKTLHPGVSSAESVAVAATLGFGGEAQKGGSARLIGGTRYNSSKLTNE